MRLFCGRVAVVVSLAGPMLATDNAVLQWDAALIQAVRTTRMGPPMVSRALAIVHTAMYDAWAAYDEVAVGTTLGAGLRRPGSERSTVNREKAISYAAYRTLVDLYPTQVALFDAKMKEYGYDPADQTTDSNSPVGIGNIVSKALLQTRWHDGANQLSDLAPGAYADYTGYKPINTPDTVTDPNAWQPIRLPSGAVQSWLVPQWSKVQPFALRSAPQFRPGPPPPYGSALYAQRCADVLRISDELSDREKVIAEYWSDGPGSETPPGHWASLAQQVSRKKSHTVDQDVQLFFALSNALLDAGIAVWDAKIFYDYVRPITAIRYSYRGQQVRAWAGPGQGAKTVAGESWQPYQALTFVTPPFAEYTSGHSAFSAASAEILKSFTGSDAMGLSFVYKKGASLIEPGVTPAEDVTLSWLTFSDAADEAGVSRRYGGIHFEEGDIRSRIIGRQVGVHVWEKAQAYWRGAARVPR